jgi:hypothetical protein
MRQNRTDANSGDISIDKSLFSDRIIGLISCICDAVGEVCSKVGLIYDAKRIDSWGGGFGYGGWRCG